MSSSCSGEHVSADNPAPAASVGDEPPPEHAPTPTASAAAPAGRGYLLVQCKVASKVVPARARLILGENTRDIELGSEVSVDAGAQRVEVTLADDTALVDKPTRQFDAFVEPHQKARLEAVFPWAKVQLKLLVHGKEQPPTALKLIRDGNVVAEVKSGPPAFMVSPGTYDVEVMLRGKPVRANRLAFFESSDQLIPVVANR
ncbi:MAG TPA: hypothetical protein VJR89_11785 [Polyangiales bacterium]|nr:hypothetical protein [Polyangiales bacterium]